MASARKTVTTTDPHAKTSTPVEDHEQPKHELREALATALKSALPKQEPHPRTRFHEQFRKEVDEYDRDFHKKYHDDLNTTLIFAGLFSAVASAFIVDVQTQIRPDYNQMSFAVLTMLLNATSEVPNDVTVPIVTGPNQAAVEVQAILCGSLASALLAAFLATLGKQWLNLHADGSVIDRNHHRELKMRGMIAWRFHLVMECPPLIMQGSLLLLGYALARYFWDLSRKVSSVIIGFTGSGLAFYLLIVVAATISKACPFKTPLSVLLRTILERYGEEIKSITKRALRLLGSQQPQSGLIPRHNQVPTPPIPSGVEDHASEVRADSRCIHTMFRITKASESVVAIMKYIPEITWDSRLRSVPLLPVYQALRESLWCSADGRVSPQAGARERAFLSAKALLYLYLQRRCLHGIDKSLTSQAKLIETDLRKRPLGCPPLGKDFDLESTFYIIEWTFGLQPDIPWSELKLGESHRQWLIRILQYRAWDVLRTGGELTKDVKEFICDSLDRSTSLNSVAADCLFIIHMVVGHRPQAKEFLKEDRSHQVTELVDSIFSALEGLFEQGMPDSDITKAETALSLVVMVHDERIGQKSFALFQKIMGLAENDHRLRPSAAVSMNGAFSPTARVSHVDDLKAVLDFLHHHISSQQRGTFGDEPIYHAFRAIDSSDAASRRGLARYDFTSPLFIHTITQVLANKDYKDLQEIAIVILPELDSQLFTSDRGFRDPGKAKAFVDAWWAAVENCRTYKPRRVDRAAAQVFFAIVDSPCLRVHIPPDAWDIADNFHYIREANPPSLQRCMQNSDLLPFVKQASPDVGLPFWMHMLWMMHHSLSREVLDQMEKETRESILRECEVIGAVPVFTPTGCCESWISMFDRYLKAWNKELGNLDPSDQAVLGLQASQKLVIEARKRLLEIGEEVVKHHSSARKWW